MGLQAAVSRSSAAELSAAPALTRRARLAVDLGPAPGDAAPASRPSIPTRKGSPSGARSGPLAWADRRSRRGRAPAPHRPRAYWRRRGRQSTLAEDRPLAAREQARPRRPARVRGGRESWPARGPRRRSPGPSARRGRPSVRAQAAGSGTAGSGAGISAHLPRSGGSEASPERSLARRELTRPRIERQLSATGARRFVGPAGNLPSASRAGALRAGDVFGCLGPTLAKTPGSSSYSSPPTWSVARPSSTA